MLQVLFIFFLAICAIYAIKFIMLLIQLTRSGVKQRNLGDEFVENVNRLSQLKLEDKNSIFSKSYNIAKELFHHNDRMCIAFAFKAESGYDKAINELNYNHEEAIEFSLAYAIASIHLKLDFKESIEFAKEQIRQTRKSKAINKLKDKNSIFYNIAEKIFNYNDSMTFAFKAESVYDKAINELNYNHEEATQFALAYAFAFASIHLSEFGHIKTQI